MLSGKRFRLKEETVAVETIAGKRLAVQVPANSVVTVESGPRADARRMVDILWEVRKMVMFADDIQKRGVEVTEASA